MFGCQPQQLICFPCPPIPPPPIFPKPPLRGPIQGSTNGAQANPGEVGEFFTRSMSGTLTVPGNSNVVTTITPLSLGPGDWDIMASLNISMLFNGCSFVLNPSLPGASATMSTTQWLPGATQAAFTAVDVVSRRIQFLTAAAATILQFDIRVSNTGAPSETGPWTFTVNARRMR